MIARIWRGAVRSGDARAYAEYVQRTGIEGYERTPGNRGAWVLWRTDGDRAEIITVSLWESRAAIEGFAGQDIEKAVFYPDDDQFLIERDLTVRHYEVAGAELPLRRRPGSGVFGGGGGGVAAHGFGGDLGVSGWPEAMASRKSVARTVPDTM